MTFECRVMAMEQPSSSRSSAPGPDPQRNYGVAPMQSLKYVEADVQFVTASVPPSDAVHLNGAVSNLFVNRKPFPYLVGGNRWVPRD